MNRKHYTSAFKAKVVFEALRETKPLSQIAAEHEVGYTHLDGFIHMPVNWTWPLRGQYFHREAVEICQI